MISVDGGRTKVRLTEEGKLNLLTPQKNYKTEWIEPKLLTIYTVDEQGKKIKTGETPLINDGTYMVSQSEVTTTRNLVDCKNRFQQWALANFTQNPEYVIVEELGADHAKEFTAQVRVQGIIYGTGRGRRKHSATKAAAEAALKNVDLG